MQVVRGRRTSAGTGGSTTRASAVNGIDEITWARHPLGRAAELDGDRHRPPPSTWTAVADVAIRTSPPISDHLLGAPLPHHPGPVLRVLELLDEAGHLVATGRAGARNEERMGSHTAFHSDMPLMRWAPQSAESSEADTPHTFSL